MIVQHGGYVLSTNNAASASKVGLERLDSFRIGISAL
jgi:hypothetical protein